MEQDYYQVSSQYPRAGLRRRKGCLSIFFIILFIILLVPAYLFVISPNLFPNKIRGDFLDAVYVPGKDGAKGFLWIQTDGSFHYVQETHTPGSYSMGRKGLFCKTYTYLYDPVDKKVIKDFKTPYDEIPPTPKMFYRDGMVWIVSQQQFSYDPIINVYNAETGELVMNTDGFVKKFPELSSGLTKLRIEEDTKRFDLDTKDGSKFVYSVDENKMYSSDKEYNDAHRKLSQDTISIFALGSESSGPRKTLYMLTGPASELLGKSISESILGDSSSARFFYHSRITTLNPGKVYLEGIMLYQDNKAAVILHQTSAGKKADRILTCITSGGKELWTLPQDELFPDMGVNEDKDPFSTAFFMKDKFSAARQGNIVIFKFLEDGMIGIDFKTGKKLWELDI